ncbi:MAG: hypothetical protein OXB95_05890 [Rhodobacteraceae bacterium]|nr:hypothetical protein [Paracoccaceae bacterium]
MNGSHIQPDAVKPAFHPAGNSGNWRLSGIRRLPLPTLRTGVERDDMLGARDLGFAWHEVLTSQSLSPDWKCPHGTSYA